MSRHAYLIICHSNFHILEKLVSALDASHNDIYIHIDRKVRNIAQIQKYLTVQNATLTYVKRMRVSWGGYSQIRAELQLLSEAIKIPHSYYHLLSGVDMPIKSQDEIYEFFESHQGKEYISIDEQSEDGSLFAARLRYFRFLQDCIGRNQGILVGIAEKMENFSLRVQTCLGIDRLCAHGGTIFKGSQWFSITHQMAEFILANKSRIHQRFRFTLCADELFLQTVAMESPYAQNITGDSMRFFDWNRGSPYVFRSEDYGMLIPSEKLFARKFDENIDMDVVDRIYNAIKPRHTQGL